MVGSNFAPGTTAADIQTALEPVAGEIVSCRITSQYPIVTAEIACAERSGAENVVAKFHNQKVRHCSGCQSGYSISMANHGDRRMVEFFQCA